MAPADLSGQPNYRQIVITAQTQDNPPPKLTAADLRLYQGDKQLAISFLQPQPVTVGILVDNSGSMQPKLPQCREALTDFIRDLDANDVIFVDTFSDRPNTLVPLTTDHSLVIDRLGTMRSYGRTALYDSIIQGLQTVAQGCTTKKALLILTDGMDSASTSSLEQATDEAQRINVPIYSIGIGETADLTHLTDVTGSSVPVVSTPVMGYGPEHVNPLSGTAQSQVVDTKTLRTLSDSTGAETFIVDVGSKNESLKRATTAIANKISNQYIIGFIGDGSTNQLRIEAPHHKQMIFKIESAKS